MGRVLLGVHPVTLDPGSAYVCTRHRLDLMEFADRGYIRRPPFGRAVSESRIQLQLEECVPGVVFARAIGYSSEIGPGSPVTF